MLSHGQARPNVTVDAAAAARPSAEARDTKDDAAQTAKPAASAKRLAASDEALAKEALEGLKRIRAKARLDKMAIPKPAPAVIKPGPHGAPRGDGAGGRGPGAGELRVDRRGQQPACDVAGR